MRRRTTVIPNTTAVASRRTTTSAAAAVPTAQPRLANGGALNAQNFNNQRQLPSEPSVRPPASSPSSRRYVDASTDTWEREWGLRRQQPQQRAAGPTPPDSLDDRPQDQLLEPARPMNPQDDVKSKVALIKSRMQQMRGFAPSTTAATAVTFAEDHDADASEDGAVDQVMKRRQDRKRANELAKRVITKWKRFALITDSRADFHYNTKLLCRFFDIWREKKERRAIVWKKQVILQTKVKFNMMLKYFWQWKDRWLAIEARKLKADQHMLLAERHEDVYLTRFYFRAWIYFIQLKHKRMKNIERALILYCRWSKRKAFNSLRIYAQMRKKKHQIYAFADAHYARQLRLRMFGEWSEKLDERGQSKQSLAHALHFHSYMLKRHALSAFRLAVARHHRNEQDKASADQHYTRQLRRRFFKTWLQRYEERLEQQYQANSKIADALFFQRSARKALRCLRQYVLVRRAKMLQKADADQFFRLHETKRAFEVLKLQSRANQYYRSLKAQADQMYEGGLIYRTFFEWINRTKQTISNDNLLREADEIARHNLLCRTWRLWIAYLQRRAQKRADEVRAAKHHARRHCRKYWSVWKSKLTKIQAVNNRLLEAYQLHMNRLKSKCFNALRQYVQYRKQKRAELDAIVEMLRRQMSKGRLRRAWIAWKQLHEQKLESNISKTRAQLHFKKLLFKTYVRRWKRYVSSRINKKALGSVADNHRQLQLKKRYLHKLRDAMLLAVSEQKKMDKADRMHARCLYAKIIASWKRFVAYRREKKQQQKEARELHRQLLLRRGVSRWLDFGLDDSLEDYILVPPDMYGSGNGTRASGNGNQQKKAQLPPPPPPLPAEPFPLHHDPTAVRRPPPRQPFDAATSIIEDYEASRSSRDVQFISSVPLFTPVDQSRRVRFEDVTQAPTFRPIAQQPQMPSMVPPPIPSFSEPRFSSYSTSPGRPSSSAQAGTSFDDQPSRESMELIQDLNALDTKLKVFEERQHANSTHVREYNALKQQLQSFYDSLPDEQLPTPVRGMRERSRWLQHQIRQFNEYKRIELVTINAIIQQKIASVAEKTRREASSSFGGVTQCL